MPFGVASVVTNAGKAIISNRMIGAGTEPKYQAIGTGATGAGRTAAVGDTALTTEVETRVAGTGSRVTTSVANDTHQEQATVTVTANRAIDEAGLFDASSAGNMYVSATLNVINLVTGDSLQGTWKVQFT